MEKVYVTRAIPEAGIDMLRSKGYEVVVSEKDGVLTKEELLQALEGQGYTAVLSLLTDAIDAAVYDAAPEAKVFSNYAVGFNNIDTEEAKNRGLVVTNTPGVLTDTVAEHTFGLLIALAQRIPQADKFTRAGEYQGWAPMLFLGTDLKGKTLGILGGGRIGTRVAEIAHRGFDMNIAYCDPNQNEKLDNECNANYCTDPETVLREADFVSVHVPLLDATHHLMNEDRLRLMKSSAYLINTSRGPIVDEHALVRVLAEGAIAGAALDVFEEEPALAPGLAELPNVVLTPHTASASLETRTKMSEIAAENIVAVLEGREPLHRVV